MQGYPSRTPVPTASPAPSRTPVPTLKDADATATPLPPRLADPAHPGYELKILRLPEASLVRSLPLLRADKSLVEYPSVAFWALNSLKYTWSPDGRILAFAAVDEGAQVNIHIYDTLLDHERQLTYQIRDAYPYRWTPDGQSLLIDQVENGLHGPYLYQTLATWLVDLQGYAQVTAIEPFYGILGWKSAEEVLVYHYVFEGPPDNLKIVNLRSGKFVSLFENTFSAIAFDPTTGTILLAFNDGTFRSSGSRPEGIYRLVGPESLKLLLSGNYSVDWDSRLRQFPVTRSTSRELSFFTIDAYGNEKLRLPDEGLNVSPNGQWILSGGKLFAADGSLVAEPGGDGAWLPDSSGFYQVFKVDGQLPAGIYLRRAANNWQPELVTNDISPQASLRLVNRCLSRP